jgi:hypothetical protein
MAQLNDFIILRGSYGYNEEQLVAAKLSASDTGEPAIVLQFSNGMTLDITASKYGMEAYEMLAAKYFDPTRAL